LAALIGKLFIYLTAEVRKMKEFADALFAKQVHIDDVRDLFIFLGRA